MTNKLVFIHELPEAKELFEIVADEKALLPIIVEKDYFVMHCLWGLYQQNIKFDLKGGTSLSKGFGIIDRFSEDIDIQIYPKNPASVATGKNQDKDEHIKSRKDFFNKTALELQVPDLKFSRDHNFDDKIKMRGAGIRAEYDSLFSSISGLKEGIVLELGFDQTTPNTACNITSWVMEKAQALKLPIIDNRALQVSCYLPEYTFVEKLQAVSTRYRLQQENQSMPVNFLRHYYDLYKLLETPRVLNFLGSKEYVDHKNKRFRSKDELDIAKNPAFTIPDPNVRRLYADEFKKKSAIYFGAQVSFGEILARINQYIVEL
jgi:predicted nucleotidyltransferase component of viral defense system